jgi:thiamine-phosphate diphosphorylase
MFILVTDGSGRPELLDQLKQACKRSIDWIQIREKEMEAGELYELTRQIVLYCPEVKVFVNTRIDVALAAGAAGVHLPEAGLSPKEAKKIAPSLIVGCSVHSKESALQKEAEGADYLYFGPIFSKTAQGLDKLEEVASAVSIPVMAIGGVTPERAADCFKRGAKAVASISHFKH